jgi:hypothetical protein
MSIFGTLLSKIFPRNHPAVQASAETAASDPISRSAPASAQAAAPSQSMPPTSPASAPPVDVEAVLNGMASSNAQKLNWRTSIVDLMKLVGMDSSLSARKELAKELGYVGSTSDSASMNMWLHKQVMKKIAENGGTLPRELQS